MRKVLACVASLFFVLSFLLTSCGTANKTEKPENAVSKLLDAVKSQDKDTVQKYLGTSSDLLNSNANGVDVSSEESLKAIYSKLKYQIKDSSDNNETATVSVEITAMDMVSLIQEYLQQMFSLSMGNAFESDDKKLSDQELEEKGNQILEELINSDEAKLTTKTITIKLNKKDTSWVVSNTDDFIDAVTGGLLSYSKTLEDTSSSSAE